jgi:hypothetical protein
MARGSFSGSGRRARGGPRFGNRGSTHFRGGRGRGRGRGRGGGPASGEPGPQREDDGTQLAERFEQVRLQDEIDEKMGFARVSEGMVKDGWLVNMHPVCTQAILGEPLTSYARVDVSERSRMAWRKSSSRFFLHSRRRWYVQMYTPTRTIFLYCLPGTSTRPVSLKQTPC